MGKEGTMEREREIDEPYERNKKEKERETGERDRKQRSERGGEGGETGIKTMIVRREKHNEREHLKERMLQRWITGVAERQGKKINTQTESIQDKRRTKVKLSR